MASGPGSTSPLTDDGECGALSAARSGVVRLLTGRLTFRRGASSY
jgi:hypothetical protein